MVSERDIERTIVGEALDHLNAACKEIDALSVHALTRSELQEVLSRLDAGEKRLATAQQRLLGRMVAAGAAALAGSGCDRGDSRTHARAPSAPSPRAR